ncbi:excinuclease ABC subunit C, partial [bacterium]|nr:excinuclease ABC subunit C [bacterium]
IIVSSEIEALLLENKLIKKHKPKYNINLKDSKTFAYIKISNEKIPKISSARQINDDGDYFGPFTNGYLRLQLEKILIEVFGLIRNNTFSNKSKIYYEIGLSPAEKESQINIEEYIKNVENAKEFLKAKNIPNILKKLNDEMEEYSKNMKYEFALEKKKQIEAIQLILQKQKVDLNKNYDQDIIVFSKDETSYIANILMMQINKGIISNKKTYNFPYDENVYIDFLKMYYSKNYIPKEIIISEELWTYEDEKNLLENYLEKFKKSKVYIKCPKIGEKKKLLDLAIENADDEFKNFKVLKELKEKLNLTKLPRIIECFDISNLSKDFLVGAMTRWVDLNPDKKNYRKFEIKSFKGKNDDYSSIREVIYRRYKRLKEENDIMPDLIIIDGGKGQLKAATDALKYLSLRNIDIISIAKGKDRKKNEIYKENIENPFIFDNNSDMILYLRKIRDSVHNFVIAYNRKKRDMKMKEEFI